MKKMVASLMLLFFLILTGCQSGETFEGTVIRVDEYGVVVEPFEDEEIRRSGTEVSISVEDDRGLEVGDRVRITHEGPIMESHPLQIDLIEIEQIV